MTTVTCVRNPFDPHGSREIRVADPGKTIAEHIAEFYPEPPEGYDVTVSVDGRIYADALPYVTKPGQSIVFCATPRGGGDGKNPLAIVAMLAIMVVAIVTVQPELAAYGATLGLGTSGAAAFAAVGTAAFMSVGGMVVSSVFPTSIPDIPGAGSFANSSTYSWTPGGNPTVEGGVLPELFGTMRITPPIIGKYIETLGDKQYFNLLFAVAGHPVGSISGDRINDTAIEDFTGVTYETRLGAVNQAVLQYFGDTRADVAVGAKLSESAWTLRTTTGNAVQGIGVGISLPKGLYYATDSGGMDPQTVKVYVEFSLHDADDWTRLQSYGTTETTIVTGRWSAGHWTPGESGGGPSWTELEAGSSTPADHLEGDPFLPTGGWAYEEGGGRDFRYPDTWRWNAAGATVMAIGSVLNDYIEITEAQTAPIHRVFYKDNLPAGQYDIRCQLVEALPSSSRYGNDTYFESFQEIIYDDFTYPGTSLLAVRALATDQLSGSMPRIDCLVTRSTVPVWTGAAYENLPADNPAWASYHLLHKGGDGVPYSRIVYADFLSWAGWCDTKGYTVNLYVDSVFSMRRALDMVGLNGRGAVVQRGSTFSCIVDRPEPLPVQRFLFTVGNIIKDSFAEEFLPMESRANAIEVTYFDAEIDYSRQTVTLYAADFDTSTQEINTTQVTLYGCTSRALAIAYGQFLLNCNRYLTLTTSFDADVDALACVTGDVIAVAHDVPQWGYSGRVASATASGIVLDRRVTLSPGTTYHVMVRHLDDDSLEELTVTAVGVETTTDTLTLTTSWAKTPAPYAVCSFGEVNRVAKAMRILRISRSQEMRRKLVCIEHVPEVYDDGAAIPVPVAVSDLPMVSRLSAREVWFGGTSTSVRLTWAGMAVGWNVYYRPSGGVWIFAGYVSNPMFQIDGLDYGVTYDFAVTPSTSPADGLIVSLGALGRDTQPAIPVPVFDDARCTYTDKIQLNWLPIADPLLGFFEVRTDLNWGNATNLIYQGLATSFTMKPTGASYTFYLKSHDTFLNYSVSYDSITLSLTVPIPVFVSIDGSKYGRVRIEWEPINDESYDVVEVWRSWTNDRAAASLAGGIHSNVFVDTDIWAGDTYYYWLRTKSIFVTFSVWESGVNAGHSVTAATLNVTEMLAELTGNISDSELATDLRTRIAPDIYFEDGTFEAGVMEDWRAGIFSEHTVLSTARIDIDEANAAITLKASQADLTAIGGRVTVAEVDIDGAQAAITLKASQSSLDVATGNIATVAAEMVLAVSQWTVKLNASGHVAGVGLMLDPLSGASEFIILANKFAIMADDGSGTFKIPFIVGNVGGESQVGVDGSLLVNGSVFANAVGTNEIIAQTANLKNLVVQTAKIDDLAVTTAKIGSLAVTRAKIDDLAVDTLKIANNAVTVPVSAASSSTLGIGEGDENATEIISATITSHGQPIHIFFLVEHTTFNGGYDLHHHIFRYSAALGEVELRYYVDYGNFNYACQQFSILDQPPADTYTYRIKSNTHTGGGTGSSVYWRNLILLETRK